MSDDRRPPSRRRDTVPSLFEARLENLGGLAVVTPERSLTYRELDAEACRHASLLAALGVRKGSVVAAVAANGDEWVTWWLACAYLGAVVVPMNTFSPPDEVERTLRHSGAHVLVAVPEFMGQRYRQDLEESLGVPLSADADVKCASAPQLRRVLWLDRIDEALAHCQPIGEDMVRALAADVEPCDPLTVVYTSGSTGAPKGVLHAHGPVVRQAERLYRMTASERSPVLWTSMPLNWVGGLTWSFLRVVVAGGTFVTQKVFEPGAALDLMRRTGVNVITAWGPIVERLRAHPDFDADWFAGMEGVITTPAPGEPAPPSALGMTETLGPHSGWGEDDYPPEASGSFGRALEGLEHRVVKPGSRDDVPDGTPGELLVRGDSLMIGRARMERHETFEPDGWFRTGDEVISNDGWIFLQRRLDDTIKTSGANVSPAEVASAISEHDGLQAAFVTSVPHRVRGADVVAFVVPVAEGSVDLDELRAHARARLAPFKVPRQFHVLPASEIPWTPSHKLDHGRLRELAKERASVD